MTDLPACLHLAMLETLVARRICRAVVVSTPAGPIHVPAEDMSSATGPEGETIRLGPVSLLDADVELAAFDEDSATIHLLMADGSAIGVTMVRSDADAVIV